MRTDSTTLIRRLLWLYIILLIGEGALRRWILPGFSGPLLIIRDPVALAAVVLGHRYLLRHPWALCFIVVGVIAIPLALAMGHGNLFTALYGARILILHIPMIFLFPVVLNREDIWKLGEFLLIVTIPMTILIGLQYSLPQSHWINVGLGGVGSAGFGGALGKYRPPGTFSFITGVSMFYPLVASLAASMWLSKWRPLPQWSILSISGLILALPISISRSLAFSYLAVFLLTLLTSVISPHAIKKQLTIAIGLIILLLPISQTKIFTDSMEAFQARWEGANEHEGGDLGAVGVIQTRIIDELGKDLSFATRVPLFGIGIGIGTSAGAQLIAGRQLLIFGESEWGAIIIELGPVLGLLLILERLLLAWKLFKLATQRALQQVFSVMPLVAMPCIYLTIGNTGQPTSLGFIVISTGIALAVIRSPLELDPYQNQDYEYHDETSSGI